MRNFIAGKGILCNYKGEDYYKRMLVDCYANGVNLSQWMMNNGYAKIYTPKPKLKPKQQGIDI